MDKAERAKLRALPQGARISSCFVTSPPIGQGDDHVLKALKITLVVLLVTSGMAFSFGAGIGAAPVFTKAAGAPSLATGLPREFGILGEVWNVLQEDYVDKSALDGKKLSVGAINGALEALADPHSAYIDAEQNRLRKTAFRGSFDGIGAEVSVENKEIVVVTPISGSPAEKAGIRPGDRIVAVNGEPTSGKGLNEVVSKIRGPRGTRVRVSVVHKGETTAIELEITRAEVKTRSVASRMLPNNLAYVRLSYFSERTNSELAEALKEVKKAGAKAMVLDLRNNPGGLLESAVTVTSQFLRDGVVLYEGDARGGSTPWKVRPGGLATELPMVVLVNKGSASGSEVTAGALQDAGRAVLIGTVTTGKGSVNRLRELSDGSALYVTFARWYTPKGRLIEGTGLTPDIAVEITDADVKDQKDTQLEKAVQYLESKLSAAVDRGHGLGVGGQTGR